MRDEPQFAPVGRYNLGFDENGKLIIYPTYMASRTVNVGPSEEYINPEFIVYPHTVKQLVDDKGKPAFSTDTYNIVHTEKHKPLNPYQGYLESKDVAPKDVQVEHLMLRQRANDAAERSDLSPFFANLMTGMYATAALEGWNNIKNGNHFTGGAEVLSPLMFGENAWNKVAQGIYGGIQLLNENGVPKTWKEIKKGNYGRATLSGAGDLFNLTLTGVGGNLIYKSALGRLNSPKVVIGPIRGIEGNTNEINISPEELYKILQNQEGYYFLGHGTGRRPSGVSEAIFNSGLRVKDGDVSNTTIPLSESNLVNWPHLNSEEIIILPGRVENVKYDYPYGRIPSDWFDTSTFHWNDNPGFSGRGLMALENPHASFTESIIKGIPGVYTKPEAVLGSYNTRTHTLRLNPNSLYKFSFRETSTAPKITEENATSISPLEWNRQFRVAEARGDVEEGLRLRILYSTVKHPDDMTLTNGKPVYFFHSTEEPLTFNAFDLSKTGLNFSEEVEGIGSDRFGRGGAWFSAKHPDDSYGEYNRKFLLHLKNSEFGEGDLLMPEDVVSNIDNLDGVIGRLERRNKEPVIAGETVVFDPKKIKLADAFTYDNNGKLIDLTERDNLAINDTRYFTGPSGQLAPRPVSYLSVDPKENPLIARISRLAEKEKVGDVYPNQRTIYSLTVNPRHLRKTIKEISPDLTENQLDLAVQIVMANRRGSHLSFGNNAGETTGGISVVDVEEAIKYLKEKGIANPTSKDLNIMVGHEKGHGVKLTKEALDAVKGFENPEEFYTLFGQVLDDAGITSTKQMPLQFDLLLKLGDNYLKKGNLDNGVRDAINFLKRFKGDTPMDKVKQRKIMSLINRFSIGAFGIYTIPKLLSDNGKIL